MKIKHEAMARTVHWLKAVFFSFFLNEENVLLVLEVMTTFHPKFRVVNVWTNNFIVTSDFILRSHQLDQSVVNDSSVGFEQSATSRQLSEVEQMLLWTNVSVISFCQLFLNLKVLL